MQQGIKPLRSVKTDWPCAIAGAQGKLCFLCGSAPSVKVDSMTWLNFAL